MQCKIKFQSTDIIDNIQPQIKKGWDSKFEMKTENNDT